MKRQIIISMFKLLFFATKNKHASHALAVSFILRSSSLPTNRQPDHQLENYPFHHPSLPYACGVPLVLSQNFTARKSSPTRRSLQDDLCESCNGCCGMGRDDCRGLESQHCLAWFGLLACLTYLGGGSRTLALLCVVCWCVK